MVATEPRRRFIVRDPRVHGGEPVIQGTRVPVRSIILSLRDDYPGDPSAVAEAYRVSLAAVEGALDFYHAHRAEIDLIAEQHDRAAHGR